MRRRHYYWVLLLLIISPFSQAADYYWCDGNAGCPVHYPSASAACESYVSNDFYANGFTLSSDSYGNIRANCKLYRKSDNSYFSTKSYERRGNSCPPDTAYNASTGSCDGPAASDGEWCDSPGNTGSHDFIMSGGVCVAPADAALADQCKAYSKHPLTKESVVTVWSWPESSEADLRNPQKATDKLGCELQLLDNIECKTFPRNIPEPYFSTDGTMHEPVVQEKTIKCKANAVLTGNVSPDPSGAPADLACVAGNPDCSITPPEQTTDGHPCTYVVDAEGRQICSSWDFKGKEGAEQCGTVNGVFSCRNDLPQAVGEGLAIGTVVETEQLADGKTKTTKTDTAMSIKCTGENACVTSTTVNKSVTTTNGDGSLDSQSGTCSGPLCQSGTNPDGNGDGLGDCVVDCGDEEGEGGPGDWYTPSEDTYASVIGAFADNVSGLPVVQGVDNFLTFTPSGACPVYTVDVMGFHIVLDQWCVGSDIPWELIKAIILGCCAFFAFRIAFM